MKSLFSSVAILTLLAAPASALAAKGGIKGPDEHAYEHANDNASFKRGADWKDERGRGRDDSVISLDKDDKKHGRKNKNRDDDEDNGLGKQKGKKDGSKDEDTDIDRKDVEKAVKKGKRVIRVIK